MQMRIKKFTIYIYIYLYTKTGNFCDKFQSSPFSEFLVIARIIILSLHLLVYIALDCPYYIVNMQTRPRTAVIINHSYAKIVRVANNYAH